MGFPGSPDGKESPAMPGDLGSMPGSGRFSGSGNDNTFHYCCLENSMVEEPGRLQSMGSHRS